MAQKAKLVVTSPGRREREVEIGQAASVGRAPDNTICLDGDVNVSRYHAVIERRGADFWLIDLGSRNGTTVNGVPVTAEHRLRDGDVIATGQTSTLIFRQAADQPPPQPSSQETSLPADAAAMAPVAETDTTQPPPPAPGLPLPLKIAGGVLALGLLAVIGVVVYSKVANSSCESRAVITHPLSGATIEGPTEVRVRVEDADCISRIIFAVNGEEFASSEKSPFSVMLDPEEVANAHDGPNVLSVIVVDKKGGKKQQSDIRIAFNFNSEPGPTPTPPVDGPTPVGPAGDNIEALAQALASQLSGKSGYVFDREFLDRIRRYTNEYRQSGLTNRVRPNRLNINKAFDSQGLNKLLGYVLAMSRSKFNENETRDGLGMWQVPLAVAQARGYIKQGETEAVFKDPQRGPEIAAQYTKDLMNLFQRDDFMYAISCYGMPADQVGPFSSQINGTDAAARRDFWRMVKSGIIKPDQADRVARFFAAGIVGENPKAFGLTAEQPLSSMF